MRDVKMDLSVILSAEGHEDIVAKASCVSGYRNEYASVETWIVAGQTFECYADRRIRLITSGQSIIRIGEDRRSHQIRVRRQPISGWRSIGVG